MGETSTSRGSYSKVVGFGQIRGRDVPAPKMDAHGIWLLFLPSLLWPTPPGPFNTPAPY